MLKQLLKERGIGEIWDQKKSWEKRQEELKELLCTYEYGKTEQKEKSLSWEVIREYDQAFSGKAVLREICLRAEFEEGMFSFPCTAVIPHAEQMVPFFVLIRFGKTDWNIPMEEIVDHGFGLLTFDYQDVAPDRAEPVPSDEKTPDVTNFLRKDTGERKCGQIAAWAWGASKVLDYAQTLRELDADRAAVVGHSRLGKTALYAGAVDPRFSCVIANDSGCGGAALYRGIKGETLTDVARNFPHWMCDRYQEFADKPECFPLDQHMVIAAIAPRRVYVSAADEDAWADYEAMYLACAAASEVYEKLGLEGLVSPDRLPQTGDVFHGGRIGFHLRKGPHDMGREDWLHFMEFMKQE